jgi:hypothetical protein
MLHKAIVVKNSGIEGKGLFASEEIKAGEVIWRKDPGEARFHIDVIRSWPKEKQEKFFWHAYQVDDEWYHGPEDGVVTDPADYMNHSCDPNTWFVDDETMVARRDIKKGEEITYDYATSESNENFVMRCDCGVSNCRNVIRGTDCYTDQSLQKLYGRHVMVHVYKKVNKIKNRRTQSIQ